MDIKSYIPGNRMGWWGGRDKRVRCVEDDKVVIATKKDAQHKAEKINERGKGIFLMEAYKCKNGFWHVGHGRKLNPQTQK